GWDPPLVPTTRAHSERPTTRSARSGMRCAVPCELSHHWRRSRLVLQRSPMPEGPVRRRLVAPVAALSLFFGAFFVGSAKADGTLTIRHVGCTGMSVSPNPLPAGSHTVLVYDDDNCNASFSLSGPGVNVSSDLNSTGMGIDHPAGPFGPFSFQAGATYTARDSNISASASFTTAGGGSTGGTGGSGSTGGGGGPSGGARRSGGKRPATPAASRKPEEPRPALPPDNGRRGGAPRRARRPSAEPHRGGVR